MWSHSSINFRFVALVDIQPTLIYGQEVCRSAHCRVQCWDRHSLASFPRRWAMCVAVIVSGTNYRINRQHSRPNNCKKSEKPNCRASFAIILIWLIRRRFIQWSYQIMKCKWTWTTESVRATNIYFQFHSLSNPRVPCKSGIIPSIDLTKWADYGQEYSPHQYVRMHFHSKGINFDFIFRFGSFQNILNEIPNTVVSFKK